MKKSKKIILVAVVLLIIMLIIISVIVKQDIKQSDILIEVKEGTLSKDGVELVITNNTGEYLYYGEWYEIEKKGIFGWNKIELDEHDVALVSYKFYGKVLERKIDWAREYGSLEKGKYRITVEFNQQYYSVEFMINS